MRRLLLVLFLLVLVSTPLAIGCSSKVSEENAASQETDDAEEYGDSDAADAK
ncbi:MAG: hypothetical protein ACYC6Y_30065 [Thermoguttaceae bacterium]